MGSSSALVIPFLFYFVGTRCWWLGKRNGYLTQVQFIRDRYDSGALGTLLFVVLVLLMLPYMLIGVKGGGDALTAITGGPLTGVPSWVGSLLVCTVIFVYVTYGGMRSTAWGQHISDDGLYGGGSGGVLCRRRPLRGSRRRDGDPSREPS